MINMLSYRIENDGTVIANLNFKPYTFGRDHKCYNKIIECLREYDAGNTAIASEIPKLVDVTWAVEDYVSASKELEVTNGRLYYQGVALEHFSFIDRLLSQMEQGLPVDRLVKFIERLLKNPNVYHIADALFDFMSKGEEACHLPIYPDGRLMTFKRVKPDGTPFHHDPSFEQRYIPLEDKYADKIADMRSTDATEENITLWLQNQPGHIVHKPRFVCDTEGSRACSDGLHSGRFDYLTHFHWNADGINMACAIDPQDILAAHCGGDWKIRSTKIECRQLVDDAVVDLAVPDRAPTPVAMPHTHEFDNDFDYEEDEDDYDYDEDLDSDYDNDDDYDDEDDLDDADELELVVDWLEVDLVRAQLAIEDRLQEVRDECQRQLNAVESDIEDNKRKASAAHYGWEISHYRSTLDVLVKRRVDLLAWEKKAHSEFWTAYNNHRDLPQVSMPYQV